MRPVVVVADTTEFKESPRLDRAGWPQLLAWSRMGIIGVAVSEVVVREADRHYLRRRSDELQKLKKAAKEFEPLAAGGQLDIPAAEALVAADVAGYRTWLQSELEEAGAEIWPLPTVSHDDLLSRDLGERKPFNSTGKGYRDALIWESVLEHLPLGENALVMLVTRNSGDFAASDGTLDDGLTAEAVAKGGEVVLGQTEPPRSSERPAP